MQKFSLAQEKKPDAVPKEVEFYLTASHSVGRDVLTLCVRKADGSPTGVPILTLDPDQPMSRFAIPDWLQLTRNASGQVATVQESLDALKA